MNKNLIIGAILIAGLIIAGAIVSVNRSDVKTVPSDEVGQKIIDFVNSELLQGRATASLTSITKEKGLYKINLSIGDQEIESYVTTDGNLFFPDAFNLEEFGLEAPEGSSQNSSFCQDTRKSASPLVEAFVVSECPFGLQMQRILNRVVKNIPSLAGNIKVRYMGAIENNKITAMHGDSEAQENLRQICLREEQPDKYWPYIDCHIQAGEVNGCLDVTGVDINGLNACMDSSSRGLNYAQGDFNLQDAYQVTGSPTLLLNGEEASEYEFGGRTSQALKDLLCCGFENQPAFCSQQLDVDSAATGFSESYASGDSNSSGSCE
jgi:hypothetical protein